MNVEAQEFLEKFFAESELNRLPESLGGGRYFDTPVTGVSIADDPIFLKFKEVVAPEHMTPVEMWEVNGLSLKDGDSAKLRVLSIIFPFVDLIREEGTKSSGMPPAVYCLARNYANPFMTSVLESTVKFFQEKGYRATAGMLSEKFNITIKKKMYSNWSERHNAFAAGLGTFSLHEGLITEVGCNIRVTSVITDAPLKVTPRKSDEPRGNCLYYANGSCRKCEDRCPAGAITATGHDKWKCWMFGQKVERKIYREYKSILKPHHRRLNGIYSKTSKPPVGCALCQFGVPCMDKNPVKR
ncbi:MAG: hypothetical protein ACFFCS_09700 [Candidatus Hodarchaeota archaeon]